MRASRVRTALIASLLTLVFARPNAARAFCRETTGEPVDGCDCSHDGLPLYWDAQTIEYAFNERGFPGIDDPTLRAVFARSFKHWTDVVCDGEPVALSLAAREETTPMTKEHIEGALNLNVIAHLSATEFLQHGDGHAFALTSTVMHDSTGEIVGGDIIFNAGLGPFALCPEGGCNDGSVDIENVATHEIGHFFGLAHSPVEDSTMECSAPPEETKKRSLEADDEAGICAIYGPNAIEERTEALHAQRAQAGCGCRVEAGGSAREQNLHRTYTRPRPSQLAWLSLLALLVARRARRSGGRRQREVRG